MALRSWRRRRRALVCRDAVALMTDYLEGVLSNVDSDRLEAHLADCPHCTEYLAQLRATVAVAGRAGATEPPAVPDETVDHLVSLYRRWQSD